MTTTLHDGVAPALLDGVEAFIKHEIEGRPRPLEASDLAAVAQAAENLGLLSDVGLWTGYLPDGQALRTIARVDTAVAFDLHQRGLAWRWAEQDDAALLLDGTCGVGGSALARWLQGRAASDDVRVLEDIYGDRPRVGVVSPAVPRLVAPVIVGERAVLRSWDRGALAVEFDPAPHGMDGLACLRWWPTANPADEVEVSPADWAVVLRQHLVGRVAMALGTVERAAVRACAYASLRVQGGRPIVGHDAVAELLADLDGTISVVETWVDAADSLDLRAVVAGARELLPRLVVAVNAAMQVLGGIGYMRDAGVEDAFRDVNTLRLVGGTPTELALVLAALRDPAAAAPPERHGPDHLAAHVPATSPLSPRSAFGSLGLTRGLISYDAASTWERDTAELPAPLRRLRRDVRAFAEATLRPVAADIDRAIVDGRPMPGAVHDVLVAGGRAGLLSDLLPVPLTFEALRRATRSWALTQSIRVEELARVDGGLMLLLSANGLGVAPILLAGDLHLLRTVVRPAFAASRAGDPQVFAYAITEPHAGSDVEESHGASAARPGTVARPVPGGWTIHGRKVFISGGDIARWVVVFAALEGHGFESWTAFLVDTTTPGFRAVRREHKMGMRASGAAELEFTGCFVPEDRVVGRLGQGWAINRATLNISRIPVAAMAVGFAQRAVDIAADHACRTVVAGQPLVHRQQVQLRLADLVAETRAIRSLVWSTARSWTATQARAAIAKVQATDRAQLVVEQAMDLVGVDAVGSGLELERVLRDVRLTRIFEGTNQINRLAIIEDLQPQLLALMSPRQSRRA